MTDITIVSDLPVTVIFLMWGQECHTECISQAEALRWIGICYDKGWLQPTEILTLNGVVLMDEEEIVQIVNQ